MLYNLFLDDERKPTDCRNYVGDGSVYDTEDWVEVTNFNDFYQTIKDKGIPKLVSFDYKILGDKNGLDCAEFLKFECEELGVPIPKYRVHSGWPGIYGEFLKILGKSK